MNKELEQLCDAYAEENPSTSKAFIGLISKMDNNSNGVSLRDALKNPDFISSSFLTIYGGSRISRSHYFFVKKSLTYLFSYFGIEAQPLPTYKEICNAANSQKTFEYFKDFSDIISFINRVGAASIPNYRKIGGYSQVKGLVCLGWAGIRQSEAASAQINDVVEKDNKLFLNTESGLHALPEDIRGTLKEVINSRFIQTKRGNIVPISGNMNYIIARSISSSTDKQELHLSTILQGFNIEAERIFKKRISYRLLKINALFVLVHEDRRKIDVREKLAFHAKRSEQAIHLSDTLLVDYNNWLDAFYSEKKG